MGKILSTSTFHFPPEEMNWHNLSENPYTWTCPATTLKGSAQLIADEKHDFRKERSTFWECATSKRHIISSSTWAVKCPHHSAITGLQNVKYSRDSWQLSRVMQPHLCKGALKLHCNNHCSSDLVWKIIFLH